MPAPQSGWAKLGDLLGGDSELEYEKGLNLGANTENALSQASERRTKMKAQMELADQLKAAQVDGARADAASGALAAGGSLKDVGDMLHQQQEYGFRADAANPNIPFSVGNRELMGVASGPVERFGAAGDGMYQDKFSDAGPTVSPVGESLIHQHEAAGNLSQAHADHPEQFRYNGTTGNSDYDAALSKAVAEHRLDPSRLNSRTAPILGRLAVANPGFNFNKASADAALQRNAPFQQRAMTMDSIPDIMNSMVTAGKKVGFNDVRTVGKMQAWMKGELNDPDMEDYMTRRNDALMTIANVMRGVGMSDQAHRAEIEVAAPTMSPAALDGWLNGQLASLKPRLDRVHAITNLGEHDTAAPHAAAAPAAGPPVGFVDGGYRFKGGDPNVQANWELVQ